MPEPKEIFDQIAEQFAKSPGVVRGQMFGMPTVKVKGKAFMTYLPGEVIFKLSGAELASALTLPGAHLYDPMGNGRLMKEWVVVPVADSAAWEALAEQALGYVASLPVK
jgi:hypothetical protein